MFNNYAFSTVSMKTPCVKYYTLNILVSNLFLMRWHNVFRIYLLMNVQLLHIHTAYIHLTEFYPFPHRKNNCYLNSCILPIFSIPCAFRKGEVTSFGQWVSSRKYSSLKSKTEVQNRECPMPSFHWLKWEGRSQGSQGISWWQRLHQPGSVRDCRHTAFLSPGPHYLYAMS